MSLSGIQSLQSSITNLTRIAEVSRRMTNTAAHAKHVSSVVPACDFGSMRNEISHMIESIAARIMPAMEATVREFESALEKTQQDLQSLETHVEQEVSTRVESISASYDEEISAEASEIEALRERISEIDAEIARIDAESVTLDDRSDAQDGENRLREAQAQEDRLDEALQKAETRLDDVEGLILRSQEALVDAVDQFRKRVPASLHSLSDTLERLYVARTELTTLHAALVGSLEAHFLPSLECWEKKHIELLEEHKSELESSLEEVMDEKEILLVQGVTLDDTVQQIYRLLSNPD